MGIVILDWLENWQNGVNTTLPYDKLPDSASPLALNVDNGNGTPEKRLGLVTLNAAPVSGSYALVGFYEFRHRDTTSGAYTSYLLLADTNGALSWIAPAGGSVTAISAPSLSAGSYYGSWATANNVAFYANGKASVKVRLDATGPTIVGETFGISPPDSAPTIADSSSSGSNDGSYEAVYTFYNEHTGCESAPSPIGTGTITSGKSIDWSAVDVDTTSTNNPVQATHRRLYLRNISTQAKFYYVDQIADNSATTKTTSSVDSNLTVVGPYSYENAVLPTGTQAICWHRNRMFAATADKLYYSKIGYPEAFNLALFEYVAPDDGQQIRNVVSMFGTLLIFKDRSVYELSGTDPGSWTIKLLLADVGTVSARSVVPDENLLHFWDEQKGHVILDATGGVPDPVGLKAIESEVRAVNPAHMDEICGVFDAQNSRVLWSVPGPGESRNTRILPWSTRLKCYESTYWDPMDAASLCTFHDANGLLWVGLGGYAGQAFKMGSGTSDGVVQGTVQVTVTPGATSITQISGTGFDDDGGKLIERKVTLVDANGLFVARRRITTNSTSSLTLDSAITGLTIGAAYTAYIGAPRFEFETSWIANKEVPSLMKRRFEFLYLQGIGAVTVGLDLSFNWDSGTGQTKTLTLSAASATWNASIWTAASYGTKTVQHGRVRVGRTGQVWKARIRHYLPGALTIHRLGMRSEVMSDQR